MKKLTLLTLVVAGIYAAPTLVRAEDTVPPKPPGGTEAPKPAGDKPEAKRGEGRPGGPGAPGAGPRMNPEERLKMLTEKLNLSQEQQDKIKAIYAKNGPELRELMAKGRENMTEADKTKIRELMRSQMEDIGAVLTPEQKEKMKELRPVGERRPGARPGKPGDAK